MQSLSSLSGIGSLILAFISLIILGYIAFKTMQYTAKPNLTVKILGDISLSFERARPFSRWRWRPSRCHWLKRSETAVLKFALRNKGHWYAKPAIVVHELYVNFDSRFDLLGAEYGSALERTLVKRDGRLGKRDARGFNSKYFQFSDIHLFHGEPNEEVHIKLDAPAEPGLYECWVSATTRSEAFRVHRFTLKVV